MPDSRPSNQAIRLLQLLMAAAVVFPLGLFVYAAWSNYRAALARTDERIERALDVVQEHALKVMETVARTTGELIAIVEDDTDEQIMAKEAELNRRFKAIVDSLPQLLSIWVIDKEGRSLASSRVFPVSREPRFAQRDFFLVQVEEDRRGYIGEVYASPLDGSNLVGVSTRRNAADGSFNGIVLIGVRPDYFRQFYERLRTGLADQIGLVHPNGSFVARYPSPREGRLTLTPQSGFRRSVSANPVSGRYVTVAELDGVERQFGYRALPNYPLYITAAIDLSALRADTYAAMTTHLLVGVPATLLLVAITYVALRRTRGFYEEIERREIAEAGLKQAQRMEAVGRLTGGVAHDFNNLLMVISGNVERLKRDAADPKSTRALDAIDKAARRGTSLTRQLLSFSRRQAHKPIVIDLSRRLLKLHEMLQSSLRGDIALTLDVAHAVWPVKVDPAELELALLNLAVNARDAMSQGGTFAIAVSNSPGIVVEGGNRRRDYVTLTFSDTGTGIPPDVLPHVFEPFFTTKETGRGTGLGLSQIYGFATQSGGAVTAGNGPEGGAVITLHLPRSLEAAPVEAESTPAPVFDPYVGTALIVEDNPEVAEITLGMFRAVGFQTRHADSVAAALGVIEADATVSFVFSDVVMPGGASGLDLAHELEKLRPDLPVLLASGYSRFAQDAVAEGFVLLPKPYSLEDLRTAIQSVIERRRAAAPVA